MLPSTLFVKISQICSYNKKKSIFKNINYVCNSTAHNKLDVNGNSHREIVFPKYWLQFCD